MSIATLDLLPKNPAFAFMGFVESRNLLLSTELENASNMAGAPKSNPEQLPTLDLAQPKTIPANDGSPAKSLSEERLGFMSGLDDIAEEVPQRDDITVARTSNTTYNNSGEEKPAEANVSVNVAADAVANAATYAIANTAPEATESDNTRYTSLSLAIPSQALERSQTSDYHDEVLGVLHGYHTVFLLDDSSTTRLLWRWTITLLRSCIDQLISLDPPAHFSIDLMSTDMTSDIDILSLTSLFPSGNHFSYQTLYRGLDKYRRYLFSDPMGPKGHKGLNMIILTCGFPNEPNGVISSLLMDASDRYKYAAMESCGLESLRPPFGIQLAITSQNTVSSSYFQHVKELMTAETEVSVHQAAGVERIMHP